MRLCEAERAAAVDQAPGREESAGLERPQEARLHLHGRERLAVAQRRRESEAHGSVREDADDATLDEAHRVLVSLFDLHREHSLAVAVRRDLQSNELGHRRRQLHSRTTERITSPAAMAANASSTSPSP